LRWSRQALVSNLVWLIDPASRRGGLSAYVHQLTFVWNCSTIVRTDVGSTALSWPAAMPLAFANRMAFVPPQQGKAIHKQQQAKADADDGILDSG